jgi:hypothetical protein
MLQSKVMQIASETELTLYDGITTDELDIATINAALQNVQEDIEFDKIATRLLLKVIYKRCTWVLMMKLILKRFIMQVLKLVSRNWRS